MARADDAVTLAHPGRGRHCIAGPDVFGIAVLPHGCALPYHTIHALVKSTRRRQRHDKRPRDAGIVYNIVRRLLMRRNMNGEEESSCCYYEDVGKESSSSYYYEDVGNSRPRPRVSSSELAELLRIKPCLRQPDSERRRLSLRVRFC